jgi:hypothetical protein
MHTLFFRQLACLALVGLFALVGNAQAETTVIDNPGTGTNRIEVTGNQSDGDARVRCGEQRNDTGKGSGNSSGSSNNNTTNVNSVNITGKSLQGKTIIVTGGGRDGCPAKPDKAGKQGANVNSVNIR